MFLELNWKITFCNKYWNYVTLFLQLTNAFTIKVLNLTTVDFLLFVKSQSKWMLEMSTNWISGFVWSWTVAPLQKSRRDCEWFDGHKKCFGEISLYFHFGAEYNRDFKCSPKGLMLGERGRCRLCLKCDGTRAETRFHLSAKRTTPFKSAGASVQSTTGSRGVRICGNNAEYTTFRGIVKGTGYPLHSPVSPSLPLPRVTVCHHISTGLYLELCLWAYVDILWTFFPVLLWETLLKLSILDTPCVY